MEKIKETTQESTLMKGKAHIRGDGCGLWSGMLETDHMVALRSSQGEVVSQLVVVGTVGQLQEVVNNNKVGDGGSEHKEGNRGWKEWGKRRRREWGCGCLVFTQNKMGEKVSIGWVRKKKLRDYFNLKKLENVKKMIYI